MKYYDVQYRQDGEQMLGSKDYDSRLQAEQAFENAEFSGKCDVIELHLCYEDKPSFENILLKTKKKGE